MWAAFVRQIAAYAITRRGKKLFAFIGAMLLCFATTLLFDMRLYLTAGFTAVLALVAVAAWVVQNFKLKRKWRELQKRSAEVASHRAEKAKARGEAIDRTKAAVSGALRDTAQAVSDAAASTARFFADGFSEIADEVSQAYNETTQAVTGRVAAGAQAVSHDAATLMQAARDALARAFAFFRRASEAPAPPPALAEQRLAGPHAIPQIGAARRAN